MKKLLLFLCAFLASLTVGAQDGQVLTKDGHSVTLYPYHYTGTNDYELIITSEEVMEGLGGSFWNINGLGTDMRNSMVKSDDGKTLTFNVTSTSAPNIYTPLYVLMPGEVVFDQPTLTWIEKTAEATTSLTVTAANTEIKAGKTTGLTVKNQAGSVLLAENIDFTSGNTDVATVDESGVVTGVAAGTAVITATLKSDNTISATVTITVVAAPEVTAAPTPDKAADNVMSIYSDQYTPAAANVGYDNWGSVTAFSGIEINGNPTLKFQNMDYYGIVLNAQLDVADMEYLHLDVYAEDAGSLGVVPIWWNASAGANYPEIRKTISLSEGQWVSVDIPLTDFDDASRVGTYIVHQIKLDNGNNNTIYVDNIYFWKSAEQVTVTALTVEAASTTINIGKTTQLTVKNQDGKRLSASNITFTSSNDNVATVSEAGVVTAVAEGTATITASWNEDNSISNTVAITVEGVFRPTENPTAPTDGASNVLAVYSATYGKGLNDQNPGWGGGPNPKYTSVSEVEISDAHKVVYVQGTGFCNRTQNSVSLSSAYTKVHVAVYPKTATSAKIYGDNMYPSAIEVTGLTPKTWNYIDVENTIFSTNYINIELVGETEFYLDHFYFSMLAAGELDVKVADGVAIVVGDITAANVDQVNNADAMFIDLTGVNTIEEGVTITPLHANALISVSGTHAESPATADDKYAPIAGTKNMVVKDTWLFPVSQIQIVDDPANEPLWCGEGTNADIKFISTGSAGYKISRTIKAKAIGSIYLPGNVNTLPDGVTAWEAVNYSAEEGVTFNKAGVVAAFFPYVIVNSNNSEVTITSEGTGDLAIYTWGTGNVAPHQVGTSDAYVQGCLSTIETSASDSPLKYAISSSATHAGGETANVTLQPCKGVKISPFRAFFYGFDAAAGAPVLARFDDGSGTTKISEIRNGEFTESVVYDLQGRQVLNPTKGLYIINGKKVIIK